jgi:hypothetical protein
MLLISYLTCFLMTLMLRRLAMKLTTLPVWLKAILSTVFLQMIGGSAGFLSDLYSQDPINPHFAFDAGFLVVPTLGWLILIGGAANAGARDLETRLAETVDQLGWLRARINLVSWFDKGELSRLLHSEVQSVLHAGIVRFEAGASKADRDLALASMQSQIQEAFTKRASEINLESLVQDQQEFWSDVCEIQSVISPEANQALARDVVGKSILWDIIKESCGNAIRHGKATETQVTIELAKPNQLQIRIANNGERPAEKLGAGLGTSILNACAITWSLRPDREKVVLTALLPIEASI